MSPDHHLKAQRELDKYGEIIIELGLEGIELETKADFSDISSFLDQDTLQKLCPKRYSVGIVSPTLSSIHDFYAFSGPKGSYHAFTVVHNPFDTALKIKGKKYRIHLEGIVMLSRSEKRIENIEDGGLIDFLLETSQKSKKEGVVLEKVGTLHKEKMNMSLFGEGTGRLFVVTPSICTVENGAELHQLEIEYGGKREKVLAKIDPYYELAHLAKAVYNQLPSKMGKTLISSEITKFNWVRDQNAR